MGSSGVKKSRPVSKGLLKRVSLYIRDNAINGKCIQDEETMAYHLGLTVETVNRVIEQLKENKLVMVEESKKANLPNAYIYLGDGAASRLVLETGQRSEDLIAMLDRADLSEDVKNLILDYDEKVRELLYEMQQQTQELEQHRSFKDSIVKVNETPDGLVQVIARRRP
ncbi:hypothetical protein [Desulfofalx alkaliphila]|uniref:hypothetical protein n=1 Tax=Desulfofalx alkaliphila TaxID=105483 RepID=UPI0004E20E7F|nr:hypothetical protein [Desulfofalx alkaliphila]